MIKIKGDRTCPVCRGLMPAAAYRTTSGKRRRYFDRLSCAVKYFNKRHDFEFDEEFVLQFLEKVEFRSERC